LFGRRIRIRSGDVVRISRPSNSGYAGREWCVSLARARAVYIASVSRIWETVAIVHGLAVAADTRERYVIARDGWRSNGHCWIRTAGRGLAITVGVGSLVRRTRNHRSTGVGWIDYYIEATTLTRRCRT